MKSRTNKILAPLVLGTALMQLASCGGGGGGSSAGSGASPAEPRQLEQDAEGMYVAQIQTMNNGVGGPVSGNLSINKEGSRFIAYVRLNGGKPRVVHQQRVHVGTSCPTMAQDTNGDGYVDVNEAFAHVGKILFPLDADISAQERGSSIWPAGDIYGYYHWERATNFERFISDLREPDLNAENEYAKLGEGGALNLDGRVVLIHGAEEIANLPDSVGTRGRLRNFQTIPIACGVIRKVDNIPGAYEDDPSLGPVVGETVGGSSGADDGATVPVDGVYRPGEDTGEEGPTNSNDGRVDDGGGSSGSGDGGIRWPWERPRTTTGGSGGGGTSGGTTSGGSTSGGSTSGETSGGSTSGGNYGDDEE